MMSCLRHEIGRDCLVKRADCPRRRLPTIPHCVCGIRISICSYTEIPYLYVILDRFDPAKDAVDREKHALPLIFGDRIFDHEDHLIVPSIRAQDGEERFKMIGGVGQKLFTGIFVWRDDQPRFISVRRSNTGEKRAYRAGR